MKPYLMTLVMAVILINMALVNSYSPNSPEHVHQYITNESRDVWVLIPYEIEMHLFNSLNKSISDTDYDLGDDIIIASGEEDNPPLNVVEHLWDPDVTENGTYNDGVYIFGSAYQKALRLWKTKVIPLYLKGEINESYYWLGRVVHLLEDQSVPAHAHNDDHNKIFTDTNADTFEDYASIVFLNYKGANYSGKLYYYEDLPNMTPKNWNEVDAIDKDNIELFRLFWFTAQRAQYFASDDRDGNTVYVNLSGQQKNFNPSLWGGEDVNIVSDSNQISSNLSYISDAEIPHAMKAVAGLYRLFWDAVHVDWPTNRHDNRRTGVTLLKGDFNNVNSVDSLNLYLTDAQDQEYVIRTSIADLDGNSYMEAVSVSHEQYDSVTGKLFAFEHKKKWETCPSWIPFCWEDKKKWITSLGRSVLSPPTAGNIDLTSRKEVLAPRRNGSLLVFDVGTSGGSISQLCEFLAGSKFSNFLGSNYSAELSGSAIADIDLDGKDDIILTDWATRGLYDWPAEVYVLNESCNEKFSATFGNGGAYGSPSIANILGGTL